MEKKRVATRAELIELARAARAMPGGPTGQLYERERALEELGIKKLVAPEGAYLLIRRTRGLCYPEPPETSALRAPWFGWSLVNGRWNW